MASSGRVNPLYAYRETAFARRQLDSLAENDAKFQEWWVGFFWLVLRNPRAGTLLSTTKPYFAIKSFDFLAIGQPKIFVIYCIPHDLIVEVVEVRKLS